MSILEDLSLREHLECDRTQQIAYLETCNPKSTAFYQRYGFEVQRTIQIADFPDIFPMIRYPKNKGTSF